MAVPTSATAGVSQTGLPAVRNLGRQDSLWQPFFTAYTSTAIPSSAGAPQWVLTDGLNGAIMWVIQENNVAGGATVTIEGCYDITLAYIESSGGAAVWFNVGIAVVVANGTTNTTLSRAQGAQSITQNTASVFQCLDAYPYMRCYVSANASSASLSALVYGLAQ